MTRTSAEFWRPGKSQNQGRISRRNSRSDPRIPAGRPCRFATRSLDHIPTLSQSDKPMRAILDVVLLLLDFYQYVLIAAAVMSWLIAFNVVNLRNQFVSVIYDVLY